MKIAINKCYGGFCLSDKAIERILFKKGIEFEKIQEVWGYCYYHKGHLNEDDYFIGWNELSSDRTNKELIETIEELGEESFGEYSELKIVEIPDDVDFIIEEYDGNEWVAEVHRTWA
jgi:hypothetical protein